MKKLIISIKSPTQALDEVKGRLEYAQKKGGKVAPHYEISFSDMRQFKRFVGNIDILTAIQAFRPKSLYELAQALQKDIGNINRLIAFFEDIGAVRIEERVVRGRNVKTPIVDYQRIEFDLVA